MGRRKGGGGGSVAGEIMFGQDVKFESASPKLMRLLHIVIFSAAR